MKDERGSVLTCIIKTYGDTVHTFVQNIDFTGEFLPGYKPHKSVEAINKLLGPIPLNFIDHIACSQPVGDMEPTVAWYEKMLDFHAFWCGDEEMLKSEYSSVRSTVMTDKNETVMLNINEAAPGKKIN